jgi:hypothetical protein
MSRAESEADFLVNPLLINVGMKPAQWEEEYEDESALSLAE